MQGGEETPLGEPVLVLVSDEVEFVPFGSYVIDITDTSVSMAGDARNLERDDF